MQKLCDDLSVERRFCQHGLKETRGSTIILLKKLVTGFCALECCPCAVCHFVGRYCGGFATATQQPSLLLAPGCHDHYDQAKPYENPSAVCWHCQRLRMPRALKRLLISFSLLIQ